MSAAAGDCGVFSLSFDSKATGPSSTTCAHLLSPWCCAIVRFLPIFQIYRESRFVGAANTAEIFINNQHVCRLVNGSYCTHVTEPGPIEIKALQKVPPIFVLADIISRLLGKQPLIEFTADPGREYFLEFNVAGYKVKQVSKDKALGMMNGLETAKSHSE